MEVLEMNRNLLELKVVIVDSYCQIWVHFAICPMDHDSNVIGRCVIDVDVSYQRHSIWTDRALDFWCGREARQEFIDDALDSNIQKLKTCIDMGWDLMQRANDNPVYNDCDDDATDGAKEH